jgi:hypothetical protein
VTAISVPADLSARHGGVAVPLVIDGTFRLTMLITAFPSSAVSADAIADLPVFFESTAPGRYLMRRASLGGEPVVDLVVGVSRQIGRIEADDAFGQDFLRRFTDINLNLPSSTLTFIGP